MHLGVRHSWGRVWVVMLKHLQEVHFVQTWKRSPGTHDSCSKHKLHFCYCLWFFRFVYYMQSCDKTCSNIAVKNCILYLSITLQPMVLIIPGLPPIASLHFRGGTPSKIMDVRSTLGQHSQTGHLKLPFTLLPILFNILELSQLHLSGSLKSWLGSTPASSW